MPLKPILAALLSVCVVAPALAHDDRTVAPVPPGYARVWDDGRLNPLRGVGTPGGDAQMRLKWTDTVPRKLIAAPSTEATTTSPERGTIYTPVSGIYVEVGRFRDSARAEVIATALDQRGFNARRGVVRNGYGETPIVLAGPYASRADAEASAQRLQQMGFRRAAVRN